ncbi:MAG: 3'-5' exonuclease [Prevotellaceae bacterium]|jgi:predicted PolB exonuclease-like 3'-5' exonuclease|nr:3'-5' exonuclease [Prevotellaceae bacterium]
MNKNLEKILFLDIETVPQTEFLHSLPSDLRALWIEKIENIRQRMPDSISDELTDDENFMKTAGVYSEFSKIICISVGCFYRKDNKLVFRVKSFSGDDEKSILNDFSTLLQKIIITPEYQICGHNIKEFDIPFICRRLLINNLEVPACINVAGKKPWETPFIDTLELWRFGDYKNYTSLKLLSTVFGIPTPKDDIDASQVAEIFYRGKNIARIAIYCQKDVIATARLYQRFCSLPMLQDEDIEFAD